MSDSDKPDPILDYSNAHERTSVLAIVAVIVSILAFPVAIILPAMTSALRAPMSEGEVISQYLKTALPLGFAEILSVRSLAVVFQSRKTTTPLKGESLAIAAVIFSTAWLLLLAVATFVDR